MQPKITSSPGHNGFFEAERYKTESLRNGIDQDDSGYHSLSYER
jgi:hypothetical protein